jgi:site-specific DNA recombinase
MRIKGNKIIKGVHKPLVDKKLWDACQKIKGLRSANHREVNGHIAKPLMGLLTCRVCGHAVTGESHRKASGKIYIYYHCAYQACPERKVNSTQEELFKQLNAAFDPFSRFTPAATKSFIETLQTRMQDLELYTQKATGELAEKRMKLKENILKLEQLHKDGLLNAEEHRELMAIKSASLDDVKIEIDAHNEADHKTFKEGLRIIELFVKVYYFMSLEGNELEKVRLARLVLSNPTLANRTIEYSYQIPFNVLLELTSEKIWWRRRGLNPSPKIF